MFSTWPWTKFDHGEHRKNTPPAASSGVPGPAERDQHRGHPAQLVRDAELDLLAADLHRVRVVLGGGQARLDVAEGDGVDVDLELAPLLGERLRQADDRRLARRVVRLAGIAHRARDRRDVDDLAEHLVALLALRLGGLAHVRRDRTAHPERDDEWMSSILWNHSSLILWIGASSV